MNQVLKKEMSLGERIGDWINQIDATSVKFKVLGFIPGFGVVTQYLVSINSIHNKNSTTNMDNILEPQVTRTLWCDLALVVASISFMILFDAIAAFTPIAPFYATLISVGLLGLGGLFFLQAIARRILQWDIRNRQFLNSHL
jgi:hypothetical protein